MAIPLSSLTHEPASGYIEKHDVFVQHCGGPPEIRNFASTPGVLSVDAPNSFEKPPSDRGKIHLSAQSKLRPDHEQQTVEFT